jgi:pimeloyl-ACP methyl ester carboxylesterase
VESSPEDYVRDSYGSADSAFAITGFRWPLWTNWCLTRHGYIKVDRCVRRTVIPEKFATGRSAGFFEKGWLMVTIEDNRPTLLLVHGAWHGSWCWEKLQSELAAKGWTTHAVDLPSVAEKGTPSFGMYDDAGVIREYLDHLDGPAVIIAHSYGGIPVTQAAAGTSNVTQIIYLAAFQLDEGDSLTGFVGENQFPAADEGTVPPPEDPDKAFYEDVEAGEAARAIARLRPQSVPSITEKLTIAAWETIPSSYVICEQDQAVPPALQEHMASRAGIVHRLPTGHSPFLSRPTELATLITEIASTNRPMETPAVS